MKPNFKDVDRWLDSLHERRVECRPNSPENPFTPNVLRIGLVHGLIE